MNSAELTFFRITSKAQCLVDQLRCPKKLASPDWPQSHSRISDVSLCFANNGMTRKRSHHQYFLNLRHQILRLWPRGLCRHKGRNYPAYAVYCSLQYAKKGIRCNSILPGLMHTPLVEARLANHRISGDSKKLIEDRNNAVPVGWMRWERHS